MTLRYDVLVVDLDGTLLAPDGSVSARNRRAVARAREAGMTIVIATGRALVESTESLQAIRHDGLVIAAGGSLLCEAATGRTLERRIMPQDIVADVARTMQKHGHLALILKDAHAAGYDYLVVGDGELDAASAWWFRTLPVEVRFADVVEDDPDPQDTVRAGAVARGEDIEPMADELRRELGKRAFLQHWPAVTSNHADDRSTHLLEVFNPNVTKWTMLESWCLNGNVDPARVAVIGDGLNDVEIVANAGLGVAMGNADPRVRDKASRHTATNEEDGVAVAVDMILSGAW